jgi:hypothetical protein
VVSKSERGTRLDLGGLVRSETDTTAELDDALGWSVLIAGMELLDICSKNLAPDPKRVCRREPLVVLLDLQAGGVVKIDCERWDMLRV